MRPLHHCADIESNSTVQCFEFVFAVSEGFASAIGFLAVTVAYVYIIVYLFIEAIASSEPGSCTKKLAYFGFVCLLIVPTIIALIIFIVILSVPLFRDVAFMTGENALTFFAYWLCFAYVGPFVTFYLTFSLFYSVLWENAYSLYELSSLRRC